MSEWGARLGERVGGSGGLGVPARHPQALGRKSPAGRGSRASLSSLATWSRSRAPASVSSPARPSAPPPAPGPHAPSPATRHPPGPGARGPGPAWVRPPLVFAPRVPRGLGLGGPAGFASTCVPRTPRGQRRRNQRTFFLRGSRGRRGRAAASRQRGSGSRSFPRRTPLF